MTTSGNPIVAMDAVLAVDLGGTSVKAAVVDWRGAVTGTVTSPSAESAGAEAWTDNAVSTAMRARASADTAPAAVGLSVPGAVDRNAGVLLDLVDRLPAGDGIRLEDAFAALELPVIADNDARAALAAERRWGIAADVDSVVMLTLGTGLGGAALSDGAVPGSGVLGGNQLGHFTVDLDGPSCVCGNRGCGETFASATGLRRLAADFGLATDDPKLVFAAAATGDEVAQKVVERFALGLAAVVVNAVHAYQPELVVFGGGLAGSAHVFLPTVRRIVAERAWTLPRGRTRLSVSALLDRPGVLGAAAVAFERFETDTSSIETPDKRRAS